MVMATDLSFAGNLDESQSKSDAMTEGNTVSERDGSLDEKQSSRGLRSKTSRPNSNFITKNDLEELTKHGKDKEQATNPLESDEVHSKSDTHSQVAHMRQLLLLHLELIQQQQEKLQKRDRELNQLKIEKEQVFIAPMAHFIVAKLSYFVRIIIIMLCINFCHFYFGWVSGLSHGSNMAPWHIAFQSHGIFNELAFTSGFVTSA